MTQAASRIVHPLEPLWDAQSRVLILGTMPSPRSRAAGFYYAHPQNRFWRTLAAVFDEPVPQTTAERQAGDLVYFAWSGSIDHVGIYLGGGQFIHASTSQGVVVDSLYDSYYASGYYGATRVIFD